MSGDRSARLADRLAELDAARFVGRRDLLDPLGVTLADPRGADVLFVHAPGGMGKSALLRAVARAAAEHGRPVWTIDGRRLAPSVEALRAATDAAREADRPVLLIDSFEQIESLAGALRDDILPALPAATVVVIAGRRPPAPLWFRDGWEHLLQVRALRALDEDESDELLGRYGMSGEPGRRTRQWSQGSPLALHVAARAGQAPERADLAGTIADRLLAEEADGIDPNVLSVASIARAVDGRLLAAALGDRASARVGIAALNTLTVCEPYGSRVALHDVVRAALRTELRARDPKRFGELTMRVADYLHDRVVGGETHLLEELAELVESRAMQWSVAGATFRVDRPLPGDAEAVASALNAGDRRWWPGVERWFREAPAWVTVVRDRDGGLAAFAIAVTPGNAPPWVDADPVLGPWLAHARVHHPHGDVVVWRESHDLRRAGSAAEINAILNLPGHLRAALPRVRVLYGVVDSSDAERRRVSADVSAVHVAELDVVDGGRRLEVHALDLGPGGLVGALRALVHAEHGAPLAAPRARADAAAVREALRRYHDSAALAANPLAVGDTAADRAASVRALLTTACDEAFDPAEEAGVLLRRAYLDPDGGHRRAMGEALISRTSYFRRLGDAVERLVAALALE